MQIQVKLMAYVNVQIKDQNEENLSDFDLDMVVGARWACGIFQKLLIS